MSKPDPLSWTLRFKKHKTTVLLMLPAEESIDSTKEKLLHALKARDTKEINGDPVPDDPSDIELGVPIDPNEPNKGWTLLEPDDHTEEANGGTKKSTARSKAAMKPTLQSVNIRNNQAIAFRFRQRRDEQDDLDDLERQIDDPGWDVVLPSLDDEE
ncbi:hypothetical protein VTN49DRAFT_1980 [Thermomyces lanuginosus]|uniref:uncharacterized protein n=1 Tax=Thermomyces lanuginosus TaxID=5541 RepID=UPI003741EA3B